jgi:hypothetical protein
MKYFQFRVSKDSSLDSELHQISQELWLKMKDSLRCRENGQDKSEQFQYTVRFRLREHLQKYPNCGLAPECHEDIEGGPWVSDTDKIYILSSRANLEHCINQISNEVLEDLAETFEIAGKYELHPLLSKSLGHELAKRIYFNPGCKKIPFCELQL